MHKYSLHWAVHPGKDSTWYEHQKTRRSEDAVARELDINYSLSVSGKVFASFREGRHVSKDEIKFDKKSPVYRIWDWGKTNCVLYAQIDRYDRKRLLHERVLGKPDQPSSFEEQMRVALNDSKTLFPECQFIDIGDPAGSDDDHRGTIPEIQQLWEKHRIKVNWERIRELPTKDRKGRARTLLNSDLQATPGGSEAFLLYCSPNNDLGCPILKKAFQGGYCYKKDTNGNILDKIKEPNHPYEDVVDCLLYLYLETDGIGSTNFENVDIWFNNSDTNDYTGL